MTNHELSARTQGIEQRGEPVPPGYTYNPRRTPSLLRKAVVAKEQPDETRKGDGKARP